MKVDILFIDPASSKPYDHDSIENDVLGGTEQSTIRLAEGFASKGHRVAVIQRFNRPIVKSDNGVQYLPEYMGKSVRGRNTIFIRGCGRWENFKDTKLFLWLHDASKPDHNNMTKQVPDLIKYNVQAVAVSDWHIKNLLGISPGMPLVRVYSPVDETCYERPRATKVDHNQLVWMSSPHKGLKDALRVFKQLREIDRSMKLAVFNPGYYNEYLGEHENVVFIQDASRRVVKSVVSQSLCLFYPTQFEETFGLVAAEANALGTPIASYEIAALAESSVGPFARSEQYFIEQILEWKNGKRPMVSGQQRFRFNSIYPEWCKLLDL